jgi:tRNA wybutosine-synthesizing protein 2
MTTMPNIPGRVLALIVPQSLVQTVRDALEAHDKLDKLSKIRPLSSNSNQARSGKSEKPNRYLIPTTEVHEENLYHVAYEESLLRLLTELDLQHLLFDISYKTTRLTPKTSQKPTQPINGLARTVRNRLLSLPISLLPTSADDLISSTRWSYMIYPPLLLLPATTFSAPCWPDLLSKIPKAQLTELYASICAAFKTTHLALEGPIPSTSSTGTNILRSPSNLTSLHGDFGPALPSSPEHSPTISDFENAFWCSTSQNGIAQTWAPRYTMFSRGNLSEKKRVLELKSLTKEELGGTDPRETSAVDLYAGIGYFAFSYVMAGVGKVLCWELNPWSVEGMRRGAEKNGCGSKIIDRDEVMEPRNEGELERERLLVFQENNEKAGERVQRMRDHIPPVRHVNCGLLPTSSGSWAIAVQALDPLQGGWIHAHENVRARDIEQKKEEIVERFKALVHVHYGSQRFSITCSHVETVKSYGPAINHMVFDIAVLPFEPHHTTPTLPSPPTQAASG